MRRAQGTRASQGLVSAGLLAIPIACSGPTFRGDVASIEGMRFAPSGEGRAMGDREIADARASRAAAWSDDGGRLRAARERLLVIVPE